LPRVRRAALSEAFTPHEIPTCPVDGAALAAGNLVAELWRDSPLRRTTYGIMFFFGVGMYLGLLCWPGDLGGLLLWASLGAIIGSIAAWAGSRRGPELGLVPLGGLLLVVALVALGQTGRIFWLGVAGAAGGIFLMPLQAYVRRALGDARGWAAIGLLAGAGVLAGGALFYLLFMLNWPVRAQVYLLAGLTLGLTLFALHHLPHQTVCAVMRLIGALFYRVKARGTANIPAGGALVLCNHLSYVDAVVLQIASPRPLRFMAFAGFAKSPVVRYLFRAAGVIPVNPNKPLKGIRLAWDALQAGELVCIFPEGEISRTGQLMELRRGFETIVQHAKVPVVPAAIDGLWGSVYSFAGNRYLWKSPRLMPTHVCVVFGPAIRSEQADVAHLRKAMLDVGAEAFQERPMLQRHLGREIARALAKRPRHIELVDRTAERRAVSAGQLPHRGRGDPVALPAEKCPRETRRHRPAAGRRRAHRQPGDRLCRQGAGQPQLHRRQDRHRGLAQAGGDQHGHHPPTPCARRCRIFRFRPTRST